ncbi:MAG TPA: radical SAM protein [Phycisphaerae bacterium]|nr:radical SAM protein [Phycisphaerae bacterium]
MARAGVDSYRGFEQGPIRPPSEAYSLLIRVTRNCPWNRCTFCPVYKGAKFSLRSVEDVKRDIDAVYEHVEKLRRARDESGPGRDDEVDRLAASVDSKEARVFSAAAHWLFGGGLKSVFLQDANSLAAKPRDLVEILTHLRERFPSIERITSYARSQTVAFRKDDELRAIREAGLDRLHIGLESGSDEVLKLVRKGCTKQMHIEAGLKAKRAGFEVSEYYMPGLGGRRLSEQHALESADALNKIDPHFIRLRTLAIPDGVPLSEDQREGRFEKCTDVMVARELLAFIENLDGISSVIKSDHILNLFSDLHGRLPQDRAAMIGMLRAFLEMDPERQSRYQVGRRLGLLSCIRDMDDPRRMSLIDESYHRLRVTPQNVDEVTDELVTAYI